MNDVETCQEAFDRAELEADRHTLEQLIADDFVSIGPRGFALSKRQWIDRHDFFTYLSLDISDREIRRYDRAAIVRNVQRNRGRHVDDEVAAAVRVSQVWVQQGDEWRIAGIQFSPLADG